jgi:hypothetical protein
VPGVIDLLDGPAMERELQLHFQDPSNHDRIFAYTNNRVMQYNDHIRGMRGLPKSLTVGEHVINNTTISFGKAGMMSVEEEFEITKVSSTTTTLHIDAGVELEVFYVTLVGDHQTFENVPIPADREHFNALTKHYANKKSWQKYYQLKNNYPDLRPRDAATIHKGQGSTHDTVFIDMEDLSACRDPDTAARLLYVGATRARKRIVMYGNLAKKFGGIIT